VLSPGKWHLRVRKEPIENLKFRRHVLRWAAGNPARQKALIEACRQDILFYINTFVWQFNPSGSSTPTISAKRMRRL